MIKWFKSNKELKREIKSKESQIGLMREHLMTQNKEILSLKKEIRDLKKLLDIAENTKRY